MQPDKPSRLKPQPKLAKARNRYTWLGIGVFAAVFWGSFIKFAVPRLLPATPPASAEVSGDRPQAAIPFDPKYQTYELESATVHVVELAFEERPEVVVAEELMTVADFAQQEKALVVLNGGFFDPHNGKTTSHLVSQAQSVGDPADNERLVGNPDLAPYMAQILNRSEFRVYDCQTGDPRYDITLHGAPAPTGCVISSALGAGPQLLPEDTSYEEGFTDYDGGELIRDAIGSTGANARSAIALTADDTILLVMVAQRSDAPGLTLAEVADFAVSLGAVKLLNLDGGSSSSLYYDGRTYLGRLDTENNPIERPVKSVIVVSP